MNLGRSKILNSAQTRYSLLTNLQAFTNIGRHCQKSTLEVHSSALVVYRHVILKNLMHHVEGVKVSLLNFAKEEPLGKVGVQQL
ncbi:unnamed protein product, partial [Vitis vinifera]